MASILPQFYIVQVDARAPMLGIIMFRIFVAICSERCILSVTVLEDLKKIKVKDSTLFLLFLCVGGLCVLERKAPGTLSIGFGATAVFSA